MFLDIARRCGGSGSGPHRLSAGMTAAGSRLAPAAVAAITAPRMAVLARWLPMRHLLTLGVGLLLLTFTLQKDWVRINWDKIQGDLGLYQVIDPDTKVFKRRE